MADYALKRAAERGGAMERLLAKKTVKDDSEAIRKRLAARAKKQDLVKRMRKGVLRQMLWEQLEPQLIEDRLNRDTVTDKGVDRTLRLRDQGLQKTKQRHLKSWKPSAQWPKQRQLSEEEQRLQDLEGDTGNLKDGTALAKASKTVTTFQPMYSHLLLRYRVVQVSSGYSHTLICTASGVALSFGRGRAGQLGHGVREHNFRPSIIAALENAHVIGVAAGLHHSCAITDATGPGLFTFGQNNRGQLGRDLDLSHSATPAAVTRVFGHANSEIHIDAVQVAAGYHHSAVVLTDGAVLTWGDNRYGQLGIGSVPTRGVQVQGFAPGPGMPRRVRGPIGRGGTYTAEHISLGARHTVVVTAGGSVWTCGCGDHGKLGHGDTASLGQLRCIDSFSHHFITHADAGKEHTLCCSDEGVAFSFGSNAELQLGQHLPEESFAGPAGQRIAPSTAASRSSSPSRRRRRRDSISRQTSRSMQSQSSVNNENAAPNMQSRISTATGHFSTAQQQPAASLHMCAHPGVIPALSSKRVVRVSAGGTHSYFQTSQGDVYSCGTAGNNARLGHEDDMPVEIPKLISYFKKRVKIETDRWIVGFASPLYGGKREQPSLDVALSDPRDVAMLNGVVIGGNRVGNEAFADAAELLGDCRYANLRNEVRHVFRSLNTKTGGTLDALQLGKLFGRVGIFIFDYQIDRMCKKYDGRGRTVTEEGVLQFIDDTRKHDQKGVLYRFWRRNLCPKRRPWLREKSLTAFLEHFQKLSQEANEPLSNQVISLFLKPEPPPGKKQPRKSELRRFKRLNLGILDLRKCAITDLQFKALIEAQRRVPILHRLDIRNNLISDASVDAVLDLLDWQLDLDDMEMDTTVCFNCNEICEFNTPHVETCFCIACGSTLYRPRYFLWDLTLLDTRTPKQDLEWAKLDFEVDVIEQCSERLLSRKPMSPNEFQFFIDNIAHEHLEQHMQRHDAEGQRTSGRKRRRHLVLKQACRTDFVAWIEQVSSEVLRPMYRRWSAWELLESSRAQALSAAKRIWSQLDGSFPTTIDAIELVCQSELARTKREICSAKWFVEELMPVSQEVLFRCCRDMFRRMVANNLDMIPMHISSGEKYVTIAMQSGRVVTIGNQESMVESFQQEILGNLPARFRMMLNKQRVKQIRKQDARRRIMASRCSSEGSSHVFGGMEGGQAARSQWESNDNDDDDNDNADGEAAGDGPESPVRRSPDRASRRGRMRGQQIPPFRDVSMHFMANDDGAYEQDSAAEEKFSVEEDVFEPADDTCSVHSRSNFDHSSSSSRNSADNFTDSSLEGTDGGDEARNDVSYYDAHESDVFRVSSAVMHARDVMSDPLDFESQFQIMHNVFSSSEYALRQAKEQSVVVDKPLQSNQERATYADDDESTQRYIAMQAYDEEHDGERFLSKDSVYVFSGGRTTIQKFKLGASDQAGPMQELVGEKRVFFSDLRPRLRERDWLGRKIE